MANVKCNACGKHYNYYEHGCCPDCGAYNRPPRRNRVDADGTVHHLSDAEFLDNTAARRRSQSGKVCFEREECHEEKVRKPSGFAAFGERPSPFDRVPRTSGDRKKSSPGRIVVGVIVAVMIANILPLLLTMCSVSDVEDYFSVEVAPARPEPAPDTSIYTIEAGNTFVWEDEDARVEEVHMNEEETSTEVELVVWHAEEGRVPEIVYQLPDGTVVMAKPDSISANEDNYFFYNYVLPDRAPGSECYVLFAGYTSNVYCELTLPLVEQNTGDAVIFYASMEEYFLWWAEETVVTGADLWESDSVTEVQVIVVRPGDFDEPSFLYCTEDGWENMAYCQYLEDLGEGKHRYTFHVEDRMPGSDCWAVFSDAYGEIRVLLPGAGAMTPVDDTAMSGGDEHITVDDVTLETSGSTTKIKVTVQQDIDVLDGHFAQPTLHYTDKNGEQQESGVRSANYGMWGGEATYTFRVKSMEEHSALALRFVDPLGEKPTMVVPLN